MDATIHPIPDHVVSRNSARSGRSVAKKSDLASENGCKAVIAPGSLAVEASSDKVVATWRAGGEVGGIKLPAGLLGKLGEEHKLATGVSLAEAVDDVQFTPHLGKLGYEFIPVQTTQQVLIRKPLVLFLSCRRQCWSCWVVIIGNLGCCRVAWRVVDDVGTCLRHELSYRCHTFLACPFIDILEDVAMDRFHVLVIELAGDRVLGKFLKPDRGCAFFEGPEFSWVGFPIGLAWRGELVA